ncbi:AraC family transcriptional regulator [Microlunatus endophyticus]|uniref:AraC family transcriptional regulator n=1 Tax=Microlunatus endophyticus TaxID=1716077 RepID=A0A917W8T6_9ACTN|nr:AraC family transcriptional regulator [Microlunatus endophyticus]GGL80271.1 AraC family transcriptional regulator [Microlunatus endophyticus]
MDPAALLEEIRQRVLREARPDPRTAIDGLLLSRHQTTEPDYQLTEPLFILMAQGGKRLYAGSDLVEYGPGQCLVVTTTLPLSGHFIDARPDHPALAVTLPLRAADIASLLPDLGRLPAVGMRTPGAAESAIGTLTADAALLDAVARLLRPLDRPAQSGGHPGDAAVLAPMIRREILWRLLTGPAGPRIARIGIADSSLVHVSRAIARIREDYARPIPVPGLARTAGMSNSTFHRHFRAITGMTPLQFQKLLQLQEARSLLLAGADDVTRVGQAVGYSSPTQFNREYRRLFGAPPGRDAASLRRVVSG